MPMMPSENDPIEDEMGGTPPEAIFPQPVAKGEDVDLQHVSQPVTVSPLEPQRYMTRGSIKGIEDRDGNLVFNIGNTNYLLTSNLFRALFVVP